MFSNLFLQSNKTLLNISMLLIRITVGGITFYSGAGKALGWFGGFGIEKTLEAFKNFMNIPPFWTYMCAYTELIGGFLIMIGFFTRPAAFAVMINMIVATVLTGADKFWTGGNFPFTLAVGCLAILLIGPGDYSVDAILFKRKIQDRAMASSL